MYFNKQTWKLLYLAYRFKKIYTSKFVYLYKTKKTKLPRIFWRRIKVFKIFKTIRTKINGKIRFKTKIKKRFKFRGFRYVYIHNGRKIIMKKIWFYNINLFWYIKTMLENNKKKKIKIIKKKIIQKKVVQKKKISKKK